MSKYNIQFHDIIEQNILENCFLELSKEFLGDTKTSLNQTR